MERKLTIHKMLVVICLAVMTSLIMFQIVDAEMIFNDNVGIEGELFIEKEDGGITFPDGSRQMTMPKPTWHRTLNYDVRFELVLNDDAVLDRETGLVWQKTTNDETYTWYKAQEYCNTAAIGGRKGWRLPTIDELATLIDKSQTGEFKLPEGHPFTWLKSYYWSSTSHTNASYAYRVVLIFGTAVYNDKSAEYSVRAVRSAH